LIQITDETADVREETVLQDAQRNSRGIYQRLFRGGAWMFAARAGSGVLGLGVYAILARLLPPGDLAAYFLTASVVACGVIVASLGVNDTTVRFVAESLGRNDPARARRAIIRALQLGITGALFAGLLYAALGRLLAVDLFHEMPMAAAVDMIGVWIGLAAIQKNFSNIFRGLQHFHLSSLFSGPPGFLAAGALFVLLLAFLGVRHHCDFQTVVLLSAGSTGLALFVAAALLVPRVPHSQTGQTPSMLWSHVAAVAWPLLITEVLLYVISQADLWVVGAFRPQQDVALYGAAWRLSQLVAIPLAIANAVLPPLIAQLYAQGEKSKLERMLRNFATLGGIPAVAGCLIAVLFAHRVLAIVYGGFYSGGAMVFAVLSIGQAANVLAGSCGFTLMMTGNERTMLAITCLSGAIFVVGEALIVRSFGIDGVAFVAAAVMILQNLLMLIFVKKRVGVRTHAQMWLRIFEPRAFAGQ
jgi:O-antigen/teichoic acid export membrane protein